MGFIENLIQQGIAVVHRAQQVRNQQAAAAESKRQSDAREREFHAQRQQQAVTFHQESKVDTMVADFRKLLQERVLLNGSGTEEYWQPPVLTRRPYIPFPQKDPDSIVDEVGWNIEVRVGVLPGNEGLYDEFSEKYLAVETCPDGTIVFWSGQETSLGYTSQSKPRTFVRQVIELFTIHRVEPKPLLIPEVTWRNDPDVLEETLRGAYRNPFKHRFSDNYRPYSH